MTAHKSDSQIPHKRVRAAKIPPGVYPVFAAKDAARLLRALNDPEIIAQAALVIVSKAEELRIAVLSHVERMAEAARLSNHGEVFAQAHEIRGLAGCAGLVATGRIANTLCKYLDALSRAGAAPEQSVVALHLDAIARAAHAEDEATRLGDTVANELAALVDKKLAEINNSATR